MNSAEAEALGRRWQAASGEWWQAWRPGMVWRSWGDNEGRINAVSAGAVNFGYYMVPADPAPWPDFRDAATRGAALQVVRERWESPAVHVRQRGTVLGPGGEFLPAWEVCDLYLSHEAAKRLGTKAGPVGCSGHTSEAEALVFAIENAPVSR